MLLVKASLPKVICLCHQILTGNAPLSSHDEGRPKNIYHQQESRLSQQLHQLFGTIFQWSYVWDSPSWTSRSCWRLISSEKLLMAASSEFACPILLLGFTAPCRLNTWLIFAVWVFIIFDYAIMLFHSGFFMYTIQNSAVHHCAGI